MKPKISKIVLDIDGKKIELSVEQAKELKHILCDLTGEPAPIERWYPSQPYQPLYPPLYPPYTTWKIGYADGTAIAGSDTVTIGAVRTCEN